MEGMVASQNLVDVYINKLINNIENVENNSICNYNTNFTRSTYFFI